MGSDPAHFFANLFLAQKEADWVKGTLSGLRQLLATESPLKMMKSAFYFTLKSLFVLKIFKFLSGLSGYA